MSNRGRIEAQLGFLKSTLWNSNSRIRYSSKMTGFQILLIIFVIIWRHRKCCFRTCWHKFRRSGSIARSIIQNRSYIRNQWVQSAILPHCSSESVYRNQIISLCFVVKWPLNKYPCLLTSDGSCFLNSCILLGKPESHGIWVCSATIASIMVKWASR